MRVELLEPRRIRCPRGAYGWVDLRIVTDGFLERLGRDAALTYLFFCTVGDRQGLSFWGQSKMARVLGMEPSAIQCSLNKLVAADLIAAKNRVVQVLPVPEPPAEPVLGDEALRGSSDGASSAAGASSSTAFRQLSESDITNDELHAQEVQARAHIARVIGSQEPSAAAIRRVALGLALEAKRTLTTPTAPVTRGDRRG